MDTPVPPARFARRFFEGRETFTVIGDGALGGKAAGLRRAHQALEERPDTLRFEAIEISVPTATVIRTGVFDQFVERNRLRELAAAEPGDHHVARAFQQAPLPEELAGDLWALVRNVHTPLAVRSSSLLEDALEHPFAGVYGTKMTPNDAFDPDLRFRRLVEAVKFVWASAFFRGARAAVRAAGHDPDAEKMAVIVQEVVGRTHGMRFYPDVAGVARSYNFYPVGPARPEEGVCELAFGLGKTIVDGGPAWTYSPAHPAAVPPAGSIDDLLDASQRAFWAIRMGPAPAYDPTAEDEYLVHDAVSEARHDDALAWLVSTYDPDRDRLVPGTGSAGPRLLDFALLLRGGEWPFNEAIQGLLARFGGLAGGPVEIEFAFTFPAEPGRTARLGFLQVRPMALSAGVVDLPAGELAVPEAVVASARVLGNGVMTGLCDVVFVRRDRFEARHTRAIAAEIQSLNAELVAEGRPYLLIGFGRWGSSDPWLGIPVTWSDIAGARVIVEARIAGLHADPSQGAHFFHNLLGFGIPYFSVEPGVGRIDWEWLESLPRADQREWTVRATCPALEARVDGRSGRGLVRPAGGNARG